MAVCNYSTNVINLEGCDADDVHLTNAAYDNTTGIITMTLSDGSTVTVDISTCCGAGVGADEVTGLAFDSPTRVLTLTTTNNTFTTTLPETTTILTQLNNILRYRDELGNDTDILLGYSEVIAGAATIDVTHSLNRSGVTYNLLDTATGSMIMPDTVVYLTNNQVRFTFVPAPVGNIRVKIS